jgi:hypothetical protein
MKQHQNFLNSIIQRIGIGRISRNKPSSEGIIELCHQLIISN